jgi:hypothetical protein
MDNDAAIEFLTDFDPTKLTPQQRAEYNWHSLRIDILVPIMGKIGKPAPTGITAATLAADTGHPIADVTAMIDHLDDVEHVITRNDDGTLTYRQIPWSEIYPEGRELFYEGDDPAGFAAEINLNYDLDPAASPNWGVHIPASDGLNAFTSYAFHCPAKYLDTLYGTGRYPLGS